MNHEDYEAEQESDLRDALILIIIAAVFAFGLMFAAGWIAGSFV